MNLTTYDPHKKKIVNCGEVRGNRLIRHVNSNHFFRVVNGYGIQENAFEKAIEIGIKHITLVVDSTQVTWNSTIKDWKEHGKVADYGNGKQRFLSIKYMNGQKLKTEEVKEKPKEPEVATLFDAITALSVEDREKLKVKLGVK